ncbi:MAG: hypothetical protein ACM31L_14820 [Actinomycetota bacterium]
MTTQAETKKTASGKAAAAKRPQRPRGKDVPERDDYDFRVLGSLVDAAE